MISKAFPWITLLPAHHLFTVLARLNRKCLMGKRRFFNCWLAAGIGLCVGAAAGFAQGTEKEIRAFYIGHSLMSDIPSMTKALAESGGHTKFTFRHQDIPGAPLRWQWGEKDRKADFEPQYGGRYHIHLPKGGFNVLVVTDSVPRGGKELEAETVEYLGRFVDFARKHNPEIQVYYYETWHHLTSGTPQNSEYDTASPRRNLTWRARLEADKKMWEDIVKEVNQKHPGKKPVKIIPTGQVMAAIHDAITAGKIPGWTKIEDIFSDEIHTNNYGKYIVALSHCAVLTGRSPVGLPIDIKDIWGGSYWDTKFWDGKTYPRPKEATIKAVQEIAAKALSTTEKTER